MNRSNSILALSFICFSGLAWADSGFYLGAGIASGSMTACTKTSTSDCSSTYTAYSREAGNIRLLGGYAFGRHFAIEAGLSSLGTYNVRNSAGTVVGETKASAISIAAKGTITFPKGWSIFGQARLGTADAGRTNLRRIIAGCGWPIRFQRIHGGPPMDGSDQFS